jgi:hypothetical protein
MSALGSERRYKKILVFGGIGVVVLGAGIYGIAHAVDARESAARDAAWSALNACLLGADPLKEGESAGARVANVKLGVVGVPLEKRAKPGELGWPASCGSQAYAVAEHAGGTPFGDAAQALGKALKADVAATNDLRADVDKTWAEAAKIQLKAQPAPDTPPAPKAAVPLFAGEAFRALPRLLSSNFLLSNVREAPFPGSKIHFLIDQKDMPEGPVICTATATDAAIKCMKLPEAVATLSPGLRLIGTTEDSARPFFFAGDRGQLGIFPPDGKHAIAAGVTYGAVSRGDGSISFLTRKDGGKELKLVYQPAVGATSDQVLLQPTDVELPGQAGLFWDWAVNRSSAKPSHLVARKVEGTNVKPSIDVGEIDEPAPSDKNERDAAQVAGCKSDEALVVRVRGQKTDAIAFYAGGRWSSPVKAPTHGGALTCRGLEAVTTTVDHLAERDRDFPTITQSRCNTSGCTTTTLVMKQMLAGVGEIAPADSSGSVAADANGKLLLVWNAGPVGGLRMRLAAPEQIKDAQDVIITDGREDKGGAHLSSIAQMRVLSANTYAILLLSTTAGVKALRVEPTGQLTPLAGTL